MRTVVATSVLLVAIASAGCDGSRLARSGDGPPVEPPAEQPAAAPTDGLSDDQIAEIETALIDAEALLSSIEAELAQDE